MSRKGAKKKAIAMDYLSISYSIPLRLCVSCLLGVLCVSARDKRTPWTRSIGWQNSPAGCIITRELSQGKPMPEKPVQSERSPLLRRLDQAAVAGLCLFALVSLAAYWLVHGGMSGRLIEIDRVDPLTVQFRVDLNQAAWSELVNLPYVDELLARRIVEYRDQYGPFKSVDDLRKVRGIGPKTMEHLRPYLELIPAPTVAGK